MMRRRIILGVAGLALATAALAQPPAGPARPVIKPDGTVQVPAFELPPSDLASREAGDGLRAAAALKQTAANFPRDIATARQQIDAALAPMVGMMTARYPVDITEQKIAGVPTRIFTPRGRSVDPHKVLINLHGGAFSMCFDSCSKLESIPVASVGGYKVISIDYRMAPEFKHPAGLMDIVSVYRELLKSYRPQQIGIYGCSAGGALTAQTASWLAQNKVPQPAAIGIFGAGAVPFRKGDSAYVAGYVDGNFPPPTPGKDDGAFNALTFGYFSDADMQGATISPALHPDVIAKFPPALIITGSRAMDMSPAIVTNTALLNAGVESTLIVGEALGHCYIYGKNLPESQQAYKVIAGFFKKHLH